MKVFPLDGRSRSSIVFQCNIFVIGVSNTQTHIQIKVGVNSELSCELLFNSNEFTIEVKIYSMQFNSFKWLMYSTHHYTHFYFYINYRWLPIICYSKL